MASFGENLRREREMRGVTLQEISAATKISVRFLQAMENENLGQLPGGIFTRSFIRAYAKYLGLDEERVLAEYHLVVPSESDFDISRMAVSRPEQAGSRGPVLAALVAAVLLTAGYLLYRYARTSTDLATSPSAAAPAPPPPGPAAPAATGTAAPGSGSESILPAARPTAVPRQDSVPAPVTGATNGTAPASAEAPPPPVPQPESGLVLQVAATERAWIAVDADGKMVLQRVLDPGEIETVRAKDAFDVTTGNALGIVLTLDGETLKPLGRRGEVKSIHLTRHDATRNSP